MIDATGGLMFLVRFPDGCQFHVFIHEFSVPEMNQLLSTLTRLKGTPVLLEPQIKIQQRRPVSKALSDVIYEADARFSRGLGLRDSQNISGAR